MAIIAKNDSNSGDFKPAPAGTHQAVCVDVVDLGMLETNWQGQKKVQNKIKMVWQINEAMDDGRPFLVQRRYTLSLYEMAALRKDLQAWRGRPFTDAELEGFDVETVIGANCLLTIVHETKDGKTYSNIKAVSALMKGMAKIEARDYVRIIDRPKESTHGQKQTPPPAIDISDDDIPF